MKREFVYLKSARDEEEIVKFAEEENLDDVRAHRGPDGLWRGAGWRYVGTGPEKEKEKEKEKEPC